VRVVERLAGGSVPEVQWEVKKGAHGRAGEGLAGSSLWGVSGLVSENHSGPPVWRGGVKLEGIKMTWGSPQVVSGAGSQPPRGSALRKKKNRG